MNRRDQELSLQYKKNERFEQVISSLNETLFHCQNELLEQVGEVYPTIHILGAPRSGTTFVSQLLASNLTIAHINNLIATFWKAPIYGIELSKKLITEKYQSNYESDYGRTSGINEPHEFGYFWNYHLKYENLKQKNKEHERTIDWITLSFLLKNMIYSFNSPILFKSFLLGFHSSTLIKHLPQSCFIFIERNLTDNAQSILNLRKELNGNTNIWGSIKPIQFEELKKLSVIEQIVGQILCIQYEYLKELENIPEANKIVYKYEDLCKSPNDFIDLVNEKFLHNPPILSDIRPFEKKTVKTDDSLKSEITNAKNKIIELFPYLKTIE